MAYFSNKTESEIYKERYCERCLNFRLKGSEPECPIWDLHLIKLAEQNILDFLIPRTDGMNEECTMFLYWT